MRMIQLGWLEKPGDRYRIGNRLFEIASLGGMRPEDRVEKLRFIAELVLSKLEGDPALLMRMPAGEQHMT